MGLKKQERPEAEHEATYVSHLGALMALTASFQRRLWLT